MNALHASLPIRVLAVAVGACLCTGTASAAAQRLVTVDSDSGLNVVEVGQLDFSSLDASPSYQFSVNAFVGGWAVSSSSFRGEIYTFDKAFRYRGQLARKGIGPGETSGVPHVVSINGRTLIVDPGNKKLILLDSADAFLSEIPIQGRISSVESIGSIVAIGGQFSSNGKLHRISFFNPDSARQVFALPSDDNGPFFVGEVVVGSNANSIWTIAEAGGLISQLARSSLQIVSQAQLPPPYAASQESYDPAEARPPARVLGATAAGQVALIYFAVADRTWSRGNTDPESIYDTEIVSVDIDRMVIIGINRFDGFCQPLEGWIGACLDTATGNLSLFRLQY